MSPSPDHPPHRPLGDLESFFAWGSARYGTYTQVSPLVCEGKLDLPRLQKAAQRLAERWPLLSSTIVTGRDGRPVLAPIREVVLDLRIIPRVDENQWRSAAERLINEPFPAPTPAGGEVSSSPLWSLTVLAGEDRCELVLRIHHAICDGLGVAPFFHTLLQTYAELEHSDAAAPEPRPIAPPLETFLPAGARTAATLRFFAEEAKNLVRNPRPVAAHAGSLQRTVPRFGSLSADETRAILQAAKANGTTLNTALCAAALLVAFEVLPDRRQVAFQTNIDLRRRQPVPVAPEQLGLYIYWVKTWHGRPGGSFWEFARAYHASLTGAIGRTGLPPWGFSRVARTFLAPAADKHPLLCTSDAIVSNTGVLPMAEDYGGVRPRELYTATCQTRVGTRYCWLVGTLHGRLGVAAFVRDPLDPPEMAERLVERLRHHLLQGCG